MQHAFFMISGLPDADEVEELNRFLRSVRVLQIDRSFSESRGSWFLAVEYQVGSPAKPQRGGGRRGRVDYREILEPSVFALFDRLRGWRKEQGESEGVAPYVIFTNEQLAAVARLEEFSLANLAGIDGIGEARLQKYGEKLLELCRVADGSPSDNKDGA